MKYAVKSDYCNTLLDNQLYSESKAKEVAKLETEEAKRIGYPEVTFSIIPESKIA